MDRMLSEYTEDVSFLVMTHGEIAVAEGVDENDTNDPDVATLVLSLPASGDDLALLGGRAAVRQLASRLWTVLNDDALWPSAEG